MTPQILGPDGVMRDSIEFSTTLESRFLTGTMSPNTVDMQVSLNGGDWTNDPALVSFEQDTWTVPNPEFNPDGLELMRGSNSIRVRTISPSGDASPPAEAHIRLTGESDLGVQAEAPTNVLVEQRDETVILRVSRIDQEGFRGINVYASRFEGGGVTGYQRLNVSLVTASRATQRTKDLGRVEVDSDIAPSGEELSFLVEGFQLNPAGQILQQDVQETLPIPPDTSRLRSRFHLEAVDVIEELVFEHNRRGNENSDTPTIAIGEFASLNSDEPLYYVISAVYFDDEAGVEFESAFSPEVVGRPLRVRATIGNLPVLKEGQIAESLAAAILRSNPQVRVDEGSGLRDLVIDPFATEAERMRFIFDFMVRSRSPSQLLSIDDPQNTGESAPVETSAYKLALKQAFQIRSNREVQLLIDAAFEAYASNYGVFREGGVPARGEVVFFTRTRPTRTLPIPLGSIVQAGSQQFRTTQAAEISLSQLASFFDPSTGRYRVTVPVRAVEPGVSGVVAAGQIRRIVSSLPGLSVINNSPTFGGREVETNRRLIERARRRLASVDSGTEQGLKSIAAASQGVQRAEVVAFPNDLMQRDLDSQGVHRGGKVDLWVQGESLGTVSDTLAFRFDVASNIQFRVFGDPQELRFQAIDPDISPQNPIIEVLDYPDQGYRLFNATTGEVFDLGGVVIESYNTIRLNALLPQPSVSLSDVVLGSYRRMSGSEVNLTRQPVSSILSVVGSVSGTFPERAYALKRVDSPLLSGRSVLAKDVLEIRPFEDEEGNSVPVVGGIAVQNEPHVMLEGVREPLGNLGAFFLTVEVTDTTGTIVYKGPNHPSGDSDYTILLGDETTPLSLLLTPDSDIADGQEVLVSYSHDENITVTYQTNLTIASVQSDVDSRKNITGDVLVKSAIPVPVDIQATVVLNQGTPPERANRDIRTNLTNFLSSLRLGEPLRQSDVVNIIKNTAGVSYVVLPLSLMVRQKGSQVVRERLKTDLIGNATLVQSLSTTTNLVWLLNDPLDSATTIAGGPENEYRNVFEDDLPLELLPASALMQALSAAPGRAYILGDTGAVIPGVSDDSTLLMDGVASNRLARERRTRTSNRVLVSLPAGDSPTNHQYTVTYIVGRDRGVKNIHPGDAEHIVPGEFLFVKDEDRDR